MNVKLLNPDDAQNLIKNWGSVAAVCYATETSTPEKIGKHCMNSGHFSGSRGDYIKFLITDVPRFTVDQAVRHEIGTFKNVQSFRYVDKDSFFYEVPIEITDSDEMLDKYVAHMNATGALYEEIQNYIIGKGKSKERANEQARYVLPMATHTSFVMGFTIEALIHFMNMRLCVRAEDTIRHMAKLMKEETLKVLPELSNKLVPNCEAMCWCPEGGKSCHAYPTKKELNEILAKAKGVINERENYPV